MENTFENLLNGAALIADSTLEVAGDSEIKVEASEATPKAARWASKEERQSLCQDGRVIREGKGGKAGTFYLKDFAPTKDWEGARALAGDTYHINKAPLYYRDADGNEREAIDTVATYRTDSGQFLGTVGTDTEVYQPDEPWTDIVRPIVEQIPEAMIISAMAGVFGGSDYIQGIQIDLGTFSPTGDGRDASQSYMSVLQSWDNVHSLKGKGPVRHRAVCNNTLAAQAIVWAIKHRADMRAKIDEALQMFLGIQSQNQRENELLAKMALQKVDDGTAENIFANLLLNPFDRLIGKKRDLNPLETPERYKELEKRALTTFDKNMSEFQRLLLADEGGGAAPGTAYGAYMAMSTWANHSKRTHVIDGKTETQVRLDSQMFGSGERFHQAAFGILSTL